MNYYIQGDAAKAEQIKAAFERLGYDTSFVQNLSASDNHILFTLPCDSRVHAFHTAYIEADILKRLVDIDPDYQELEPLHKFKKGDLLVHNSSNTRIISVVDVSEKYGYQVQDGGSRHHLSFNVVENEYHLWTIADAKDGDILHHSCTASNGTFIFKGVNESGKIFCHCDYDSEDHFCLGEYHHIPHSPDSKFVHPATKEQRDLLFAKMKEAGYQWDADKKELRKIQLHYDISNFYAGMPVLVRETSLNAWQYVLFSHCYVGGDGLTRFNAGLVGFIQCIPYNDDTKHLLGTTDQCDERFINW